MNHPSTPATPQPATGSLATGSLARLLRAHTAGLLAPTAAVDLLIAHQYWLTHPSFITRFVHLVATPDGQHTGAYINWQAAATCLQRGQLPCTGSEADILRIAASLATDLPINLREVLGRLDHANTAAVTSAITTANGTRQGAHPDA